MVSSRFREAADRNGTLRNGHKGKQGEQSIGCRMLTNSPVQNAQTNK